MLDSRQFIFSYNNDGQFDHYYYNADGSFIIIVYIMSIIQFKSKQDAGIEYITSVKTELESTNIYKYTSDCDKYFKISNKYKYIGYIEDNIFYVVNLVDKQFDEDFQKEIDNNISQYIKEAEAKQKEKKFKEIDYKDIRNDIRNEAEKQIKELYDNSYYINLISYQNTNEQIVNSYTTLKQNIDGQKERKVKEFENEIISLDELIKDNKQIFNELNSKYYKEMEIINKANERITKLDAGDNILEPISIPTNKIYEGLRTGELRDKANILTYVIPEYIEKMKSIITNEKEQEDARKKKKEEEERKQKEKEDASNKMELEALMESSGGKSNKKELRQKLNTMSIKQLKRLSDKNNIEYGNKNTIKSLINNYMKHI